MTLIADALSSGHILLADWLFLIAAVLFLVAAVAYAPKTNMPKAATWAASLVAAGLTLAAVALLVL